jgi:hypothetical protein
VYSIRVVVDLGTDGSSAIPHFGHAPGRSCCTSGSIGQVYAAGRTADALRGRMAEPELLLALGDGKGGGAIVVAGPIL